MNFKIEGGKPLSGTISINSSKNSAVGILCASLLNKSTTTITNVPKIEEVYRILEVLESIGMKATWNNSSLTLTPPKKYLIENLNEESAKKTRSIVMFIGPLIHLFTSFKIPQTGGCKLGSRTVEPHLLALKKLGVTITTKNDHFEVKRKKLHANEIVMYESGDTTTENILMAAAKIQGTTEIRLASANYMVQDVCHFLELFGVVIEGVGTTTLKITGVKEMDMPVSYTLSEDPIEAMLFISIAATTNSRITIKKCPIEFLELELLKLEQMGFKYKILKSYISANGFTKLVDIETFPSTLKALHEKIYARPFPGLNIDNLPFFVPIAARAKGKTLIHDWVYENRALYYLELSKLGVDILLADPHRVFITGPTKFKSAEVICPPALRPAAIILIAMLAAPGSSLLRNVYSINRGYEDLASRLRKLGANIKIAK
ncbi:MAG: UDP-N-acetylglucosamine 1-carboxyvinyltransferase [Parcubacteria group bacterium LiPW_41]|nr:MAG: UDP-N-acetylglucosamine 1-carboxyvinyltransferase [Parcubacteria group bacterium LiPW_41]